MRDICGILGLNRSSFYYQPREDPSEAVLRAEIQQLSGVRIRHTGIDVSRSCWRPKDNKRVVSRLMKAENHLRIGETFLSNHEIP